MVTATQGIVGCVCCIYIERWSCEWKHGNVKKKKKQIAARKAFVDSVGIKSADLEGEFLLGVGKGRRSSCVVKSD